MLDCIVSGPRSSEYAAGDGSDFNLWEDVVTEAPVWQEFSTPVSVLAGNDPHQGTSVGSCVVEAATIVCSEVCGCGK